MTDHATQLATWWTIGPIAAICLFAAACALGHALGARSAEYPRPRR